MINVCKNIKNDLYKKTQKFIKDRDGSVLPIIAVVLILVIILGAVNFALVVMYRDRAVVRNALDAGATSSLAAVAKEREKAIYYGEYSYCSKGYWKTKTNKDGEPYDVWVCTETTWINTESGKKNYVHLNVNTANNVAKEYFKKNMELSNFKYSIKNWNYSVKYDDKRIYEVRKNRNINRSGAKIVNKVTNPSKWWFSDFAGANTGSWTVPGGWTDERREKRNITFPRWVEVKVSVTVELPVPFGALVGRSTYDAGFDVTAYKELINAIP